MQIYCVRGNWFDYNSGRRVVLAAGDFVVAHVCDQDWQKHLGNFHVNNVGILEGPPIKVVDKTAKLPHFQKRDETKLKRR